jgi:hypothetical protein
VPVLVLRGRPRFVVFLFAPIPEFLVFAALDAASINTGASALSPDFVISDKTPFPF